MSGIELNTEQIAAMLDRDLSLPVRTSPILLRGMPGVGKTALCEQAARRCGFARLITSVASLMEVPDMAGWVYYSPGDDRARRVPCGELAEVLLSKEPVLWLIDDLGQAAEDTLKACMQWLHRTDSKLPAHVRVVAATNRREHRAGVKALISPIVNRVTQIDVKVDVDAWCRWAQNQPHVPEHMIQFMQWSAVVCGTTGEITPALCATEIPPDGESFPSPRAWESVALRESLGGYDDTVFMAMVAGDVGPGQALEYLTFRSGYLDMIQVDRILADPKAAPLPPVDKPAACAGLMASLAGKIDKKNAGQIADYVLRLLDEGRGEHVAYFATLVLKRDPTILAHTKAGHRILVDPKVQAIYQPRMNMEGSL